MARWRRRSSQRGVPNAAAGGSRCVAAFSRIPIEPIVSTARRRGGNLFGAIAYWGITCIWTAACGSGDGRQGSDSRREVLKTLALEVALPTYQDFADLSSGLQTASETFCQEPDADQFEKVQQAFQDARSSWKQAEVFAFNSHGPYSREPLRLGPKIDFWPAREDTLSGVLSGEGDLSESEVQGLGAAGRGLPAIEYLLYAADLEERKGLDAFTAEDSGDRRCDYLGALTADLQTNAKAMVDAWDPDEGDFAGELYRAGEDSEAFESLTDAINEMFNRLIFTVEDVRQLKLGKPAGKDGGEPTPNSAESRFSGRSTADMVDALQGLLAAYRGQRSDEEGVGFEEQVQRQNPALDKRFKEEVKQAMEALEAISLPLTDAVTDKPDEVDAAYQAIKTVHITLAADLAGLLGITVTFNNTDAD